LRLFKNRRYFTRASLSILLPPFDPGHGPKVFLFTGFIRQPGIPPGLLQVAMPQDLLQTFDPHPGIQQLRGAGMPQTMQRIALLPYPGLLQVPLKHRPGGGIGQGVSPLAIEEQRFSLLPFPHPFLQRPTGIHAQVHDSSRPVLLPHHQMNLAFRQIDIRNPQGKQLSNPDPGPQQPQDHRPAPNLVYHGQKSVYIPRIHRPGQGFGHLDAYSPAQHLGGNHFPLDQIPKKRFDLPQIIFYR